MLLCATCARSRVCRGAGANACPSPRCSTRRPRLARFLTFLHGQSAGGQAGELAIVQTDARGVADAVAHFGALERGEGTEVGLVVVEAAELDDRGNADAAFVGGVSERARRRSTPSRRRPTPPPTRSAASTASPCASGWRRWRCVWRRGWAQRPAPVPAPARSLRAAVGADSMSWLPVVIARLVGRQVRVPDQEEPALVLSPEERPGVVGGANRRNLEQETLIELRAELAPVDGTPVLARRLGCRRKRGLQPGDQCGGPGPVAVSHDAKSAIALTAATAAKTVAASFQADVQRREAGRSFSSRSVCAFAPALILSSSS